MEGMLHIYAKKVIESGVCWLNLLHQNLFISGLSTCTHEWSSCTYDCTCERVEELYICMRLIQVDIGGHLPISLGAPPLSLSVFQFRHNLLFLSVFWLLNFWSHFEALNDIFWENGEQHGSMGHCCSLKICSPWIDIYNEVWCTLNEDHMPKLHPWEVETPIYPNRAHSFGASSPRIRFLDVSGFALFLNNK